MIGPERWIVHCLNNLSNCFLELLESMLNTGLEYLSFVFEFLIKNFHLLTDFFIDFELNIKIQFLCLFWCIMIIFIHLKAMNERVVIDIEFRLKAVNVLPDLFDIIFRVKEQWSLQMIFLRWIDWHCLMLGRCQCANLWLHGLNLTKDVWVGFVKIVAFSWDCRFISVV